MNVSELQTLDFILKSVVQDHKLYTDKTIKIVLNCDGILIYGDLVRIEKNYIYDIQVDSSQFSQADSFGKRWLESRTSDDSEIDQITTFKEESKIFSTKEMSDFFHLVRFKYDLELLQRLATEMIRKISGKNNLSKSLFNAHFLNAGNLTHADYLDLNNFDSVKFVTLIEVSQN